MEIRSILSKQNRNLDRW